MHNDTSGTRLTLQPVAYRSRHSSALEILVDIQAVQIARHIDITKSYDQTAFCRDISEVVEQRCVPRSMIDFSRRPDIQLPCGVVSAIDSMDCLIKQPCYLLQIV